jgi:hypothetical protein
MSADEWTTVLTQIWIYSIFRVIMRGEQQLNWYRFIRRSNDSLVLVKNR